ncbi:hypothetical protein Ahy_A03g012075 isoform A [Arachis hypogaea]|uniref:NADP-dependent oxidoreductase domain-containing protein n=1 Tax=Arachis hypogaea TaxID=3818 RepID=A0A445DSH0_ARAHY|nr:hypothetical protein Ahy_A03g012075 isoform A [Arachis hypogaea]
MNIILSGVFSSGIGDHYYPSNDLDPYIKDKNDDDDSEELEDMIINPTDSVIVCARTEDDLSLLEVKLWDLSNNQPSVVASKNSNAGAVFSISLSEDNPFVLAIGGSEGKLQGLLRFLSQVSLRWLYEQGVTFAVKSYNKERMKENLEIFDFSLTSDDYQKINQIKQTRKSVNNPTTFVVADLFDGEN